MTKEKIYKLWEVTFDYEVPSDRPYERNLEVFYIIAENMGVAERKAEKFFSRDDLTREWLEKGMVRKSMREFVQEIPVPNLTLEGDVENFLIDVRLADDGVGAESKRLEYVVRPYLVKPRGK